MFGSRVLPVLLIIASVICGLSESKFKGSASGNKTLKTPWVYSLKTAEDKQVAAAVIVRNRTDTFVLCSRLQFHTELVFVSYHGLEDPLSTNPSSLIKTDLQDNNPELLICEIDIDPVTGNATVLRNWTAHDLPDFDKIKTIRFQLIISVVEDEFAPDRGICPECKSKGSLKDKEERSLSAFIKMHFKNMAMKFLIVLLLMVTLWSLLRELQERGL